MQQHAYSLEILSKVKITRCERMHILWLPSHEDSGTEKLKDREKDIGCQSLEECSCRRLPNYWYLVSFLEQVEVTVRTYTIM